MLVVDLQRRVGDREPLPEHVLAGAADPVAVIALPNEHVCGETREPARDLPDVKVVHLDDPRLPSECATYLLRVEAARRRLEQNQHGLPQTARS